MWGLGIYGPAIPSAHDASSLGQTKNGLEFFFMPAAFTSRASLTRMWEASSRTIRKLRLALVSEARSLGYAIVSLKLIAKFLGSC